MNKQLVLRAAAVGICSTATVAALISLVLVVMSAVLVLATDPVGTVAWALNVALWVTPVLLGAAAVLGFKTARIPSSHGLLPAAILLVLAGVILGAYLRFDPLLEIDRCFDAGGVWVEGICAR